jgi:uncharacterized protein
MGGDERKERSLAYNKPIPEPDPYVTQPFWDGAKQGKLMLQRCTTCNRTIFYPRVLCPNCHSTNIEWFEASGEGYIHTFAVQHRAFGGWADEVPFVTAYIDLKEGDRMFTVLRGVDATKPESIKVGAKVKVEFEPASDEVHIPFWRVAE